MTQDDEVYLEEVLLAFLRSSEKIRSVEANKNERESDIEFTVKFKLDKSFDQAFTSCPTNQFLEFFKHEQKAITK